MACAMRQQCTHEPRDMPGPCRVPRGRRDQACEGRLYFTLLAFKVDLARRRGAANRDGQRKLARLA